MPCFEPVMITRPGSLLSMTDSVKALLPLMTPQRLTCRIFRKRKMNVCLSSQVKDRIEIAMPTFFQISILPLEVEAPVAEVPAFKQSTLTLPNLSRTVLDAFFISSKEETSASIANTSDSGKLSLETASFSEELELSMSANLSFCCANVLASA